MVIVITGFSLEDVSTGGPENCIQMGVLYILVSIVYQLVIYKNEFYKTQLCTVCFVYLLINLFLSLVFVYT